MRIVAGNFRGRRLAEPRNKDIRPTSDRARETIFNVLHHGCDVDFEGKRILDLFAGTGALGLEAMSHGAAFGLFVENAAESRALIRTNVETFGLTGTTKIYRRDATNLGASGTLGTFDVAFIDPPYSKQLGEAALGSLAGGGWLNDGAVCLLEEWRRTELDIPKNFEVLDRREMADTQLVFLRYSA
ncbi:MAG: 16S rRNA (guanine(966)-N(2))-methyltransferase RsmD [Rhizobiales bacterium]|nr:16S rRNA (guanine(966)-N(2))-methyltransferase RsmD [Hyphomicrobiales bacterium]